MDELADGPIMQARLVHTLGMVCLSLALHDESRSQHENHSPLCTPDGVRPMAGE